ncbi:hypothetical protein CALCODRAFT_155172 [Calocera cornea HHB12733]|uniref:F-box domain-containing protein n=1 Tax=Calocera cornea HHB12733 TaxID=1353952 RepID=A0A165CL96_9BASI|nr:hypothetical protein CALCODRAFT_155172 [Calocera cornea HHB12733]
MSLSLALLPPTYPSAAILAVVNSLLTPRCLALPTMSPSTPAPRARESHPAAPAQRPSQAYAIQRCLPLELVLDIVDSLAAPHQSSSYTHTPEVLHTLLSLCLVSRAVSSLSFRHLYSRISFTSLPQLRAFFDPALPRAHRHTRSMGFAAGIPISSIDVKHIWALYAHSLQRLNLEGQIQWFTPSPKSGPLPGTDRLEELALIPGGQRYPLEIFSTWTDFPRLKRLAFMHAVLHDHSDNAGYYQRLPQLFPQLDILVITLPARSRRQLASFAHLLSCLPNLRKAILIEPCAPSSRRLSSPPPSPPLTPPSPRSPRSPALPSTALPTLAELEHLIGKSLLARRPHPCEIHEVSALQYGCPDSIEGKRAFKPWFAEMVREGRIWELQGRVWGREEQEQEQEERGAQVLVGEVLRLEQ